MSRIGKFIFLICLLT